MRITAKFESRAPASPVAKNAPCDASHAAKNLALAYRLAQMIDLGLIADYSAAARLLGVSQPRLTHLMSLLLLAPTIQESILTDTLSPPDKKLRRLARIAGWPEQVAALVEPRDQHLRAIEKASDLGRPPAGLPSSAPSHAQAGKNR